MFTDLKRHLEKKINQLGIKKKVQASLVCEAAEKAIVENFGKEALKFIHPKFFRNESLTLEVKSSPWASEVQNKSQEILDQINKNPLLGQGKKRVVKRIQFRVR